MNIYEEEIAKIRAENAIIDQRIKLLQEETERIRSEYERWRYEYDLKRTAERAERDAEQAAYEKRQKEYEEKRQMADEKREKAFEKRQKAYEERQKAYEERQKKYEEQRKAEKIAYEKRQKEYEEQRKADYEAYLRETEKTDARIKELNNLYGGIGESNGRFSETYIYSSLKKTRSFGGVEYQDIQKTRRRRKKTTDSTKREGEFDIYMYNGSSVALIEVKYRVRKKDVDDLINRKMVNFKSLYPEFNGYNFYLGLAGMSIDDDVENQARAKGIGLLKTQGNELEIYDKNLTVY